MWRRLFDAGVFTNPVAPPAVPPTAVPAPHQRHGHAHLRADRLRARAVRAHRTGPGGHLTDAAARPRGARAADLKRFIDLPYRLHARDPLWVPPLRRDVALLLSREKNPFFEHAEAEYFLAERGRRGRRPHRRHQQPPAQRDPRRPGRVLRLLRVRRRPGRRRRAARGRRRMVPRQRPRRAARAGVVLGERRVRAPGRRLRDAADAHDAAQPSLLRDAARAGGVREGQGSPGLPGWRPRALQARCPSGWRAVPS